MFGISPLRLPPYSESRHPIRYRTPFRLLDAVNYRRFLFRECKIPTLYPAFAGGLNPTPFPADGPVSDTR